MFNKKTFVHNDKSQTPTLSCKQLYDILTLEKQLDNLFVAKAVINFLNTQIQE